MANTWPDQPYIGVFFWPRNEATDCTETMCRACADGCEEERIGWERVTIRLIAGEPCGRCGKLMTDPAPVAASGQKERVRGNETR